MLAKSVVCFRVPTPESIDSGEAVSESRIPQSKLQSENLWNACGVTEADNFAIFDGYGNLYAVKDCCSLEEHVKDVNSHFRGIRKDLRKINKAADKLIEAGDTKAAIAKLHEGLDLGLVGYKEAEAVIESYKTLMASAKEELAKAGDDADALKNLAETYADTDVAKDIDAAVKKATGATG